MRVGKVVPHVEAGYPGPIPMSDIDQMLLVTAELSPRDARNERLSLVLTSVPFRNLLDALRRSGNVALVSKALAARQRLQGELEALERANKHRERKAAIRVNEALDHYDRVQDEAAAWLRAKRTAERRCEISVTLGSEQ